MEVILVSDVADTPREISPLAAPEPVPVPELDAATIAAFGGRVLRSGADVLPEDAVLVAELPDVRAAVDAALALQSAADGPSRRIAIDHPGVTRAATDEARLAAALAIRQAARPGQIVLTAAAQRRATELPSSQRLDSLGLRRLRDLTPARALWRLRASGTEGGGPPRDLSGIPHNLPVYPRRLIGRREELRRLASLLPDYRLVSLVAGGGVGKTRLGCTAAAVSADAFPGGVWLIELANVARASRIADEIVATIGLEDMAPGDTEAGLAQRLRGAPVLLVMDNGERHLEACGQLILRLLATCENLHVLVTSRHALEVEGEQIIELGPLALLPPDLPARSPASLRGSEAARLLLDRAPLSAPPRDPDACEALHRLCDLVEGNPLALELAAARLDHWTLPDLYERVRERFEALGENPAAAHPRQRSLWATIDWSYRLLTPARKRLFRRFSCFRGGATAASIAAVCSSADLPVEAVDDAVSELVRSHLLSREELPDRRDRFTILETLRSFAGRQIEQAGEKAAFRERHAQHYRQVALQAAPMLNGPRQAQVLQDLAADHANLYAALAWHIEAGATERGLQMAVALRRYWASSGRFGEGRRFLERLLAAADTLEDPIIAEATFCLATLAGRQSDFARAQTHLATTLEVAERLGDDALSGKAHNTLGNLAWGEGDVELAREHYLEALARMKEAEHETGIATVLNNLSLTETQQGDFASARRYLEQSLELSREIGHHRGTADGLNNLAIIVGMQSDYRHARSLLAECFVTVEGLGDRRRRALALDNLAHVAWRQGRARDARQLCGQALDLQEEIGDESGTVLSLFTRGTLALDQGELEAARQDLERARGLLTADQPQPNAAGVLRGLGELARREGRSDEARGLLDRAVALAEALPDHSALAASWYSQALLARDEGRLERAVAQARKALAKRVALGNRRGIAETLELQAALLPAPGQRAEAFALAARIRREIGAPIPPAERDELAALGRALAEEVGEAGLSQAAHRVADWRDEQALELAEATPDRA